MAFRIHTESAALQRELENKLAALDGQLDQNFEYEITAEVLPSVQALARAEEVAEQIGAEAIFVAAGIVAPEPVQAEVQQTVEIKPEVRAHPSVEHARVENPHIVSEPTPVQTERAAPRIDKEKLKQAAVERAAQTRESLQRAGVHVSAMLKRAGTWTAQKTGEAQASAAEARVRFGAKSEQWKKSAAEWNAQRLERKEAEMKARQERQRAAHREAEMAAISAHIMLERQRNDEKAQRAIEAQNRPAMKPVIQPVAPKPEKQERDTWPIWRNAFVAAACIALVGVFLLASGNKQTSAAPATSTELSKPAVVVPSPVVEHPKPAAIAPHVIAQAPKPSAKPSARKRIARSNDEEDGFQEVTVRNYQIAPPKKNAKGVTQISDME
jgi:hypothetical protein